MRFRLLPIFIMVLFSLSAIPTSGQKEAFEKIFEKETRAKGLASYGKFKNVERVSFYPDTLPRWFFRPPTSSNGSIYAIGISDPDLTPEDAILQAIHRAQSMAVLQSNALMQYYRDVYTVDHTEQRYKGYGQRFDTYFKLSANHSADSTCFSLVETHMTRYNEAVVLIRYSPSGKKSNANQIKTIGTALYIEAQIGNVFETQAEYEIITNHKSVLGVCVDSRFTYREKGKRYLAISKFMGINNEYPIYNYKYCNPSWAPNTQPLISYNGLWSIFTKKLLRYLTLNTEETSVNIRSLDETYNPEIRNLSREVAVKNAQLLINGIEFGVDSIGFDLNILEIR